MWGAIEVDCEDLLMECWYEVTRSEQPDRSSQWDKPEAGGGGNTYTLALPVLLHLISEPRAYRTTLPVVIFSSDCVLEDSG